MRACANDWVRNTFLRRLNNKKTGRIVGVMQRLHEDDTTGLLMSFGGWTNLKLPAEAKERTVITFPRSGKVIIREKDDLLFPAREGPAEIAMAKKELGAFGYAGQYQQEPSPDIGGILHRDWWQRYGTMPARFDLLLQSWDCTFKDAITSDYVVGQVWGKIGAQYYLLDQVRGQWDIVATIAQVRRLSEKWSGATLKLVESAANGEAVIGMLKHELPGMLPINVRKAGGKVVRVQAILPMVEAGNVYLPTDALAPWADAFIDECAAFPNGKYDDVVDAASQALQRFLTMDKLRTRIFFQRLSDDNYYTDAQRPDQLAFTADRSIPCAYGTAAAACVFLDIFDDGETIWIDNEYYHLGSERGEQKSDDEYVAEYKQFQGDDNRRQGTCYCDPEAEAFARALRAADIAVWTTKFDLLPGIRYAQSLLERREIKICVERCPRLVQELNEYAWDDNAAKSGIEKPMRSADYAIKALIYYILSALPKWRLTQ
jgi:predicted phage terminase large subunit-like protein